MIETHFSLKILSCFHIKKKTFYISYFSYTTCDLMIVEI